VTHADLVERHGPQPAEAGAAAPEMERVEHEAGRRVVRQVEDGLALFEGVDAGEETEKLHHRHHAETCAQLQQFAVTAGDKIEVDVIPLRLARARRRGDHPRRAEGGGDREPPAAVFHRGVMLGPVAVHPAAQGDQRRHAQPGVVEPLFEVGEAPTARDVLVEFGDPHLNLVETRRGSDPDLLRHRNRRADKGVAEKHGIETEPHHETSRGPARSVRSGGEGSRGNARRERIARP